VIETRALPPALVAPPRVDVERLDVLDVVFLIGALIAPMSLQIFGALTVYDVLIAGLAFLIAAGPRRMVPLPAGYVMPALVFLGFALFSSMRATLPLQSLTQVAQFAFVFFVQVPVVMTIARTRRLIRWSLVLFIIGSFAVVVASILTHRATSADRVLVFNSDNPNPLGYPSAYVLPFALCFVVDLWHRGRRVASLAAAAAFVGLAIASLAASASRGAAVAVLVALPLFLVFRGGRRINAGLIVRLLLTVAVIFAGAYAYYHTEYFPATLKDRIERTLADDSTLIQDRENLAVAGIREFWSSPLIGTGLDNFRYVSRRYDAAATPQAPHNLWIQFLAQVGLVGTIAFAVIIVRWFATLLREWRLGGERDRHELLGAFLASFASIMIIFMTTPIMIDRHYWLLFGLGLALVALPRDAWRGEEIA
jgi:O-antigen ligase